MLVDGALRASSVFGLNSGSGDGNHAVYFYLNNPLT